MDGRFALGEVAAIGGAKTPHSSLYACLHPSEPGEMSQHGEQSFNALRRVEAAIAVL